MGQAGQEAWSWEGWHGIIGRAAGGQCRPWVGPGGLAWVDDLVTDMQPRLCHALLFAHMAWHGIWPAGLGLVAQLRPDLLSSLRQLCHQQQDVAADDMARCLTTARTCFVALWFALHMETAAFLHAHYYRFALFYLRATLLCIPLYA